jgi:hypothetical protein
MKKAPIWLNKAENRAICQTASVAVFVANKEQASIPYVFIAGLMLRVYKFKQRDPKLSMQCTNCQRFGHAANFCYRLTKCRLCARKHFTNQHICNTCNKTGVICEHTQLKYSNCSEKHTANNMSCSLFLSTSLTTGYLRRCGRVWIRVLSNRLIKRQKGLRNRYMFTVAIQILSLSKGILAFVR